jgi:hypothetical protein
LWDTLLVLVVDAGDDRGDVLGIDAVEVEMHLARRLDGRVPVAGGCCTGARRMSY